MTEAEAVRIRTLVLAMRPLRLARLHITLEVWREASQAFDALEALLAQEPPTDHCTSMYHVWAEPASGPSEPASDQRCLCGKAMWKERRKVAMFSGYKALRPSQADGKDSLA